MARPLRIEYDGAVYHVTSRGNDRKAIYTSDADRTAFLDILADTNKRFNWLCHAYCLMNNHYHLIIETPDGNLSKGMRQLNGVYTQTYNRQHRKVGHIFQGRFKAVLVEKESHLLEACRYVVLNPVRAKAATHPEQWHWSSYKATAGSEQPHRCLTTDWVLGQFGNRKKEAARRYREFVEAGIGQESIWKKAKGRGILGEEEFIEALSGYMKGQRDMQEIPKSQRFVDRPELADIFNQRTAPRSDDRSKKIREAVEKHGYSQREIAEHLGMHYTSISRLMRTK
ncbi:MAG: REP-associated tyrosine transposase [Thermodesulfovibrionales bacterium]